MKSILIALGYACFWGVGVTLTKIALTEISATTLLMIQLSSSVVFLTLACYLRDRQLPYTWPQIKRGFAGIFEPALAYMVGIFGIQMTTASNVTLIGASEVILTILFAAVFLGEKLTRMKLLLAGISFVGVLLLMFQDAQNPNHASLVGNVLVLMGVVFAVCYVLLSKKQIASVDPLHLTSSQQLVGLIVTVFCFSALSMINPTYEVNAADIPPQFWLLAVGSGIMQYALAFLLYLMALQNLPVSQAAFYIALIPVFGVASAVVMIGEQPSLGQWMGGLLVVLSSYGANRLKTT
ncbi:DMT family transporter [Synechococcus sp. PCC 6312]|uniref:DMT family transporter n=1 Tax=Synechococcus sp. (strain ATCC 27167 / PCC 6312) TaxID=195253 RepID=UPI00029F1453|nr:DMT family transporter [Synechococcus sp. PCC 6312]AFY62517.1 putative permease, DMT superfamily [Synechococcus sp. PCC 6312]